MANTDIADDDAFDVPNKAQADPSQIADDDAFEIPAVSPQQSILPNAANSLALAAGVIRGLGQLPANIATIMNRTPAMPNANLMLLGGPVAPPNIQGVANAPAIPNPLANFGQGAVSKSPEAAHIGQIIGEGLPSLALPEIRAAEGLGGLLSPQLVDSLGSTFLGNIGRSSLNNAALGAALGPLYNPTMPLDQSIGKGALTGGMLGAAVPAATGLGLLPFRAGGRLFDVATANANRVQKGLSDNYDAINAAADSNGFRTNPNNFINNLVNTTNDFSQATTGSKRNLTLNYLQSLNRDFLLDSQNPALRDQLLSAKGTRDIADNIQNYIDDAKQKSYNNDNYNFVVKTLSGLKQDLWNDFDSSLRNQGMPEWADLFKETQKKYGQDYFPLRNYPTSLGSALGGAALGGATIAGGKLLSPLAQNLADTAATVGMMHSAPLRNVINRFASTYNGGPMGVIRPGVKTQMLNNLLIKLGLPMS